MAVNEQYPSVIPPLYPGVLATEPRPFGTLDDMWLAFQFRAILRHQPSTVKNIFLCLLLRRACGHPPRGGPGPPVMGAATAGRLSNRLHMAGEIAQ